MPVADGAAGRAGKANGRNPTMHVDGKSDGSVVPRSRRTKPRERRRRWWREGADQGEHGQAKRVPDTEPDRCAQCARIVYAKLARKDKKRTVHRAAAPCGRRSTAGGVLCLKKQAAPGVDGVTWQHYGEDLEDEPPGSPARVHRGRVSGKAVAESVHPETGWPAAAAGHRGAGGQDRPAGRGRGAECDLRERLPRLLVWLPARTWPA